MKYRIESDSLGEKQIPANAYYGIQTARALDNFPITGEKPHPELIRSIAIIKKVAAKANAEIGLLDKSISLAIRKSAREMEQGLWNNQIVVDTIQGGAGTSLNMNVNEVVANRAIEILKSSNVTVSPNSHVNMSQSTNDVIPTAVHLTLLKLAKDLGTGLNTLHKQLVIKEEEFESVIKMGRTHLQDAIPIRLGQEFGAYACVIRRDIERIEQSVRQLNKISIGATAIGTGLNARIDYREKMMEYLIEETNYPLETAENLVDITQNTDRYTEISSALKILAINLSKIANDLRLLSSGPLTGFNEINLPARQSGSSIMPGKVNPVIPEVINQISFQVIGNDHTISLASEAGQLELNVMGPVIVSNLLKSLTMLTNGVDVLSEFAIKGITANVERCRELVESSVGIVTAINPHVSYEIASKVAKEALVTGQSVRSICIRHGYLTSEELDIILDAKEMTEPGIAGSALLKKAVGIS
ncbi:aspartate ammonia-lyase [Sporosarcina pasteurii]|uniref:aspartate ammonia-lyase n=1 Tax=Sporosarcina pasteurii TaxID=1474 RepID=A0A380BLY4_SPOPA|nr:aspartate ammonia-lyase [Sporosarcina pasteurii]MDS9470943.1 aspartate ammonia-lyase [Sporosarcina pasteurii]QBQ05402.1 aspartate ammonia-lyase [Sporosarcina pasteurii]SUJ03411.1 Aspartate ammonia-lyase [Sporosarcina pasteurii]